MTSVRWTQTNKHTNTQTHTQKTYKLSKNWGNLFFTAKFFIFYFSFCNSLKVKKTVFTFFCVSCLTGTGNSTWAVGDAVLNTSATRFASGFWTRRCPWLRISWVISCKWGQQLYTAPNVGVMSSNTSSGATLQTVDQNIALSHNAVFGMRRRFRKCICRH